MTILTKGIHSEKSLVGIDCVESGVTKNALLGCIRGCLPKKSFRVGSRMQDAAVTLQTCLHQENRTFFSNDFWMSIKMLFIVNFDCSWDAKSIREDTSFVGIAKTFVKALLLYLNLGLCVEGHVLISRFMRNGMVFETFLTWRKK